MTSWDTVAVATNMGQRLRTAEERGIMWYEKATELQGRLQAKEAQIAGVVAQAKALLDALKSVSPGHQLLQLTNEVYVTGARKGERKTHLSKVFERAHDEAAKMAGIANPAAIRDN